ncbi:MAG: DUF5752 family protein [Candidatus Woesearchaeota archaeon]
MTNAEVYSARNKVLSDCVPNASFWACNGSIIRNIYELCNTLKSMDEWNFRYHVNSDLDKNDFAKWIREVLEYPELADQLYKVKDKEKYISIIEKRIRKLEAMPVQQIC